MNKRKSIYEYMKEEYEYDTNNVEEHGCIERVLPEEPSEKFCSTCFYENDEDCMNDECEIGTLSGWQPKAEAKKWICCDCKNDCKEEGLTACTGYTKKEKKHKVKLKMSQKKFKYFKEIICRDCYLSKGVWECNKSCNLDRYIKKEVK